jgi:hypothetical protein
MSRELPAFLKNPSRSSALILLGVLLFASTLTVSAGLAPAVGAGADASSTDKTLVGSQGGGPWWPEYGSVYLLNGSDVVWRESSADSYFDVTKTEVGTVLAGFMSGGYDSCGPYEPPC